MYSQQDIDKIKDLIISYVENAEDILLFGSYARGTANQDSDMDFAVLINSEIQRKEKLKLLAKIRRAIAKFGYNADVLVKVKRVFLKEVSLPTLAQVIQSEGKYIWTRT